MVNEPSVFELVRFDCILKVFSKSLVCEWRWFIPKLCFNSQADQSLRCPRETSFHHCLSKISLAKILIRSELRWAHMFKGTFSDAAAHLVLLSAVSTKFVSKLYLLDNPPNWLNPFFGGRLLSNNAIKSAKFHTWKWKVQIFLPRFRVMQSTLVISVLLISNNRLSWSENLVPVLTWKSNNR